MKKFLKLFKENRKVQIVTIIVVALIAAGIVWGFFWLSDNNWSLDDIIKHEKEEEEEDVPLSRRLDGIIVDTEEEVNPYPVAVMIENLRSVRPQAGLSEAGVVYEALAEGGIARFMAVYAGPKAEKIGPVRSSRSYYLEWVSEYDALYAFSGAYPPVLAAISGLEIKNINAMYYGSQYYWRDSGLAAPHNMFTSGEKLEFALRDQELENDTATYRGWYFEDEPNIDERTEEEKTINIDFSSANYEVEYKYDRETNSYLRFNGGVAHNDANTGEQLSPKNVVVFKLPTRVIDDKGRLEIDVIGEGEAYLFSNGEAVVGKWQKGSRTDRTMFYDENGDEYKFTRGQTWIEVIPEDKTLDYN